MRTVISIVLTSVFGFCIGVPRLDLAQLANTSDVIAIGEISNIALESSRPVPLLVRGRTIDARQYSAEFVLRTVVKGVPPSKLTLRYLLPSSEFMGYRQLHPGTRMVFLKNVDGQYSFSDPYHPDLPAVLKESLGRDSRRLELSEVIARQLSAVLESPDVTEESKLEALAAASAVDDQTPHAELMAALRAGAKRSESADLRWLFDQELLRRGDLTDFPKLASELTFQTMPVAHKDVFLGIIRYHIVDQKAVGSLVPLLQSDDRSVRSAVAESLWRIADLSTVSALLPLLDDSDMEVRYWAVKGLADSTHTKEYSPSTQEFEANEPLYLNYWHSRVPSLSPK